MSRNDLLVALLCWLGLAAFHLFFAHQIDVDDTVRLIEVRNLLGGQSWFDLTIYRIAPPEGVPMHWSRLVDLPIAGAILLARLFIDPAQAERFALTTIPLITMGCATVLTYRATLQLAGNRAAAVIAALLGCTASAVFGQLNPGRIDHHGWQIVAALTALNGLYAERARTGGFVIGGALAVWLTISIEGLPLAAAFLGVLGLRWLHDRAERTWLVSAATTLALGTLALWLATHRLNMAALTSWCDVVTPVHLAMFAWTAIGTALVACLPPGGRWRDLCLLGAVAAGGLAIYAFAAPQCLAGGFSAVDPLVQRFWLANVGEAMPVWTRPFAVGVAGALPAFLGLLALGMLIRVGRPQVSAAWWSHWLILAAATIVGCLMIRGFGVATALAMPPLAWGLWAGTKATLAQANGGRRLVGWLILLIAVSPWLVQAALLAAIRFESGDGTRPCSLADHAAELNRLPPATFFAPFDQGPDLLPATHHAILASGHHRAVAAMHDLLAAMIGTTQTAREIIARRGVGYVAMCIDSPEVHQYRQAAPDGFLSRLARGEVPGWLVEMPLSGPNAPRLWRVDIPSDAAQVTGPAASERQSPSR